MFGDLWKSYKVFTTSTAEKMQQIITETGQTAYNFGSAVSERIFGSSAHTGVYSEFQGNQGLSCDGINSVINDSGFINAAENFLVPYAQASTGRLTQITAQSQLDISGQVALYSGSTYQELFQVHLVYNGYHYDNQRYPDCCIYFSRIDQNGVLQTATVFLKPTHTPVISHEYSSGGSFDIWLYADFGSGSWTSCTLSFATTSSNTLLIEKERPADNWYIFNSAGRLGNPYGTRYRLTDATTNSNTWYNFIQTCKETGGGSSFSLPVGFGGVVAGTVINFDSLVGSLNLGGFTWDTELDGITFDLQTALDDFSDNLGNNLQEQYENFYSSIANFGETWDSQNIQNYYNLYNYQEPLPPATGGGLPDEWLQVYPSVTTVFNIEPVSGSLPVATLPALPSVAFPFEDIFDNTGLLPLALSLGILALAAALIF